MLGPKLAHHFRKLVVQVIFDSLSGFFFLWRFFTKDLGAHRTLRGERLSDSLGLEPYNGFRNHGVEHATSTVPRLRALLILETQEFQPLFVGLLPVFARSAVILNSFS